MVLVTQVEKQVPTHNNSNRIAIVGALAILQVSYYVMTILISHLLFKGILVLPLFFC